MFEPVATTAQEGGQNLPPIEEGEEAEEEGEEEEFFLTRSHWPDNAQLVLLDCEEFSPTSSEESQSLHEQGISQQMRLNDLDDDLNWYWSDSGSISLPPFPSSSSESSDENDNDESERSYEDPFGDVAVYHCIALGVHTKPPVFHFWCTKAEAYLSCFYCNETHFINHDNAWRCLVCKNVFPLLSNKRKEMAKSFSIIDKVNDQKLYNPLSLQALTRRAIRVDFPTHYPNFHSLQALPNSLQEYVADFFLTFRPV